MPLANLEVFEGTLSGPVVHTLARRAQRVIITNDSTSANLQFKFRASADYATLKPTETISVWLSIREIHLNGTGAYRAWSMG